MFVVKLIFFYATGRCDSRKYLFDMIHVDHVWDDIGVF
jgi:hypothetical protein